jgi:signal recognition particle subunit SRP54
MMDSMTQAELDSTDMI